MNSYTVRPTLPTYIWGISKLRLFDLNEFMNSQLYVHAGPNMKMLELSWNRDESQQLLTTSRSLYSCTGLGTSSTTDNSGNDYKLSVDPNMTETLLSKRCDSIIFGSGP